MIWVVSNAEGMADWEDWDCAAWTLGRKLGLFENRTFREVKGVF
jgi:hypothetical protein